MDVGRIAGEHEAFSETVFSHVRSASWRSDPGAGLPATGPVSWRSSFNDHTDQEMMWPTPLSC